MKAHTPGPWEVRDGLWPGFLDIAGPSFNIHVVTVANDLSDKDFSVRNADARLIAAAPDLLASLMEMVELRNMTIDGLSPRKHEIHIVQDALKAIDKAIGP